MHTCTSVVHTTVYTHSPYNSAADLQGRCTSSCCQILISLRVHVHVYYIACYIILHVHMVLHVYQNLKDDNCYVHNSLFKSVGALPYLQGLNNHLVLSKQQFWAGTQE